MKSYQIKVGSVYHNEVGRTREVMQVEEKKVYYRRALNGEWYESKKDTFCYWAKGEIK